MKATHKAMIRSSWRVGPVHRIGQLFFVLHPKTPTTA